MIILSENPYRDSNLETIRAMRESGSGIYNSYDYSEYQISGPQGQGISYKYVDDHGNLHTYYFTAVIGNNLDQNGSVNIDAYGSGVFSDGRYLDEYTFTGNSNSIDIRPAYGYDPYGDYYNYSKAADAFARDLVEVYGLDNNNTAVMGFSNTAKPSLVIGADRALSGTDNVIISCIELAGDSAGSITLTPEQHQALIDHNATILDIHSTHRSLTARQDFSASYEGVHTIDLSFNVVRDDGYVDDTHGVIYRYMVDNGISEVSQGNIDWSKLPTTWTDPLDGRVYNFNLTATEYYTDENGNYVSRQIKNSEIAGLLGNRLQNSYDKALKTDFSTLDSSLSTLSSYANGSSFASSSNVNVGFSGDTSVPIDEPGIVSGFLAGLTSLIGKINGEISAIQRVGDNIANIDRLLESEAQTLKMDIVGTPSPEVEIINFEDNDFDIDSLFAQIDEAQRNAVIDIKNAPTIPEDILEKIEFLSLDPTFDLDKYAENGEGGFSLWISNKRYSLDDFRDAMLRSGRNMSAEEALEAFIAVVIAESDKTVDDTLGVASVALNRCERDNWSSHYENGQNPFDQMFANYGAQYETIGNRNYENYMPSKVGEDQVNRNLAAYGTDYETLRTTVMDALEGGVRNNDYTGFRSNGYNGWDPVHHITENGNKYQYENPDIDRAQAEAARAQRVETPMTGTNYESSRTIAVTPGANIDGQCRERNPQEVSTVGPTGKTEVHTSTQSVPTETKAPVSTPKPTPTSTPTPKPTPTPETGADRLTKLQKTLKEDEMITYDNWDKNHEYPYVVKKPTTTTPTQVTEPTSTGPGSHSQSSHGSQKPEQLSTQTPVETPTPTPTQTQTGGKPTIDAVTGADASQSHPEHTVPTPSQTQTSVETPTPTPTQTKIGGKPTIDAVTGADASQSHPEHTVPTPAQTQTPVETPKPTPTQTKTGGKPTIDAVTGADASQSHPEHTAPTPTTAAERLAKLQSSLKEDEMITYDNWDKNHEYPYIVKKPTPTVTTTPSTATLDTSHTGVSQTGTPVPQRSPVQTPTIPTTTTIPVTSTPAKPVTTIPTAPVTPTPSEPTITTPVTPTPSEPTITTPVTPTPSEPTITTPVTPTPSEPTITTPVTPTPSEPTITTPVTPEPSEPTITTPVTPTPSEPTITTPVTPEPSEPTITTPVTPTPSEPTITTPVSPKPSEPTITTPVSPKPTNPGVETNPNVPIEQKPDVSETIPETTTEPFIESPSEEPAIIDFGSNKTNEEVTPVVVNNKTTNSKSSNGIGKDVLTAAGVATGVGLLAGAVALGANEASKKKNEDDGYKYEYETDSDSRPETLQTEVSGNEINAFSGGEY